MGCSDSKPIRPVDGERQLQEAAESGDFTRVKQLLAAGAPADISSPGLCWSPLHSAVSCGHSDIVKTLLENGASPELRSSFAATPLHIASSGGNVECIQYLLDKGVDINCRDDLSRTPLHGAAGEGRDEAITYLLEKGASPSFDASVTENPNIYGITPLISAVENGHVKAAKALLEGGGVDQSTLPRGSRPLSRRSSAHTQDKV